MAALSRDEIQAGIVVQLDADALRHAGRSRTNAEKTATEDRAVQGEHSFLVLSVDLAADTAFLAPLFSAWAPGSQELREDLKSGYADRYFSVTLFFNKWQHWEVPLDELADHSGAEDTGVNDRRMYAVAEGSELERILAFSQQNRAPWRTLI